MADKFKLTTTLPVLTNFKAINCSVAKFHPEVQMGGTERGERRKRMDAKRERERGEKT